MKKMSIEKKSLISTLKTTKKANVAKEDFSHSSASATAVKSPARMLSVKGSTRSPARMLSVKGSTRSAARMLGKR
jgi:hypothetical protein